MLSSSALSGRLRSKPGYDACCLPGGFTTDFSFDTLAIPVSRLSASLEIPIIVSLSRRELVIRVDFLSADCQLAPGYI